MRAIGIRTLDQPLSYAVMDVAVPSIDDTEVLVQMHAVGVGLHDGWALPSNPLFPCVIGLEGAGSIASVGRSVAGWEPGDRVMFTAMPQPKGGTWAEYVAVPAEVLVTIPDGLSFTDAAALPIAGMIALEGVKALGLSPGDAVFIAGASGAIGTLAIQLAVALGARVAASASPRNHEYLRSLGAVLPIDYADPAWTAHVLDWMPSGVDAALAIQPGTGQACVPIVRDGGKVVTISGDQVVAERRIAIEQVMHHPETRRDLAQLAADVVDGKIRVVIERVYPFAEGVEALNKTATRRAQGKLVLTLDDR